MDQQQNDPMQNDNDTNTPSFTCTHTRILNYKRQLSLADDALEAQKEEFVRKMNSFDRREEALREKDLRLQESLIKFNKFLQENENKKARATRRCAEERRQCESTDVEILQLQQKHNGKIEEEKQLSYLLAQNQRNQEYLKSVVEKAKGSSEDFTEIQDILDRYSTLKNTNDDLVSKMQINTKEHEARRSSYAHFVKKSGNEMLNMNNEIARLQKELEQVTIASNKIDSLDYGTCQNVNDLTTEISQALLVIDNMVERLEFQAHPSLSQGSGAHIASKISSLTEECGLEMKVKNAIERLDGVADLIVDYESIAEAWSGKLCVAVV